MKTIQNENCYTKVEFFFNLSLNLLSEDKIKKSVFPLIIYFIFDVSLNLWVFYFVKYRYLKQQLIIFIPSNAKIGVCNCRYFPSAGRTFEVSFLDEKRFINFLDGSGVFAHSSSDSG